MKTVVRWFTSTVSISRKLTGKSTFVSRVSWTSRASCRWFEWPLKIPPSSKWNFQMIGSFSSFFSPRSRSVSFVRPRRCCWGLLLKKSYSSRTGRRLNRYSYDVNRIQSTNLLSWMFITSMGISCCCMCIRSIRFGVSISKKIRAQLYWKIINSVSIDRI